MDVNTLISQEGRREGVLNGHNLMKGSIWMHRKELFQQNSERTPM